MHLDIAGDAEPWMYAVHQIFRGVPSMTLPERDLYMDLPGDDNYELHLLYRTWGLQKVDGVILVGDKDMSVDVRPCNSCPATIILNASGIPAAIDCPTGNTSMLMAAHHNARESV